MRNDEIGVSARLSASEVARIDALALELSKRAKGAKVTRGGVVKLAIEQGVEQLEREIDKR